MGQLGSDKLGTNQLGEEGAVAPGGTTLVTSSTSGEAIGAGVVDGSVSISSTTSTVITGEGSVTGTATPTTTTEAGHILSGTAGVESTATGEVVDGVGAGFFAPEWQITRNQSTVEPDLFDAEVVDTANPFGNYAIAYIEDSGGDKFSQYNRGTRVDFAYSLNDGLSYTERFTGYVVEARESDQAGADALEVECYSFDQLLRRDTVSNDQSGKALKAALEDIIKTDTPITWNASNVTLSDNVTLKRSLRGEEVENAIQAIAGLSGNEAFGVNNSLEFYFEPRESRNAPRDIDNSQWFDYDLPEVSKETVNEVTVFYNDGGESVTVDDGSDKLSLQDKVGTADPVGISTEVSRPSITDIDEAQAVGEDILQGRKGTLTGTVTTYGLIEAEPGDVINIEIVPRGINGNFRIAESQMNWGSDTTTFTIVKKKGNQDKLLVRMSDTLKRVENQDANRDGVNNRVVDTTVANLVTPSGSVDSVDYSTIRITNTCRNKIRDAWSGTGNISVTQLAVGTDSSEPKRSQSSLGNETARQSVTESLPDSFTAQYTADFSTADIREVGLFDTDGDMLARGVIPESGLSTPVSVTVDLTSSNDSSVENGVVTDTGQTATRDIIADNSPKLPTQFAFGSDGTAPSESDTALGTQQIKLDLTEILVDSADTNTDWESQFQSAIAADQPLKIESGELTTTRTLRAIEGENTSDSNGLTFLDVSRFSNNRAVEFLEDGDYGEWTFSFDHDIPAGNAAFAIRYEAGSSSAADTPTIRWTLDGTELDNNHSPGGTSVQWGTTAFGYTGSISAGQHTLRAEVTVSDTSEFRVDIVAPYDSRYSYNFDNTTDSNQDLDGPEQYPDLVEKRFETVTTRRPVTEARIDSTWDNVSNSQFMELSNDGGSTWHRSSNSQTASATFASESTEVDVNIGLSRYSDGSTGTPLDGNVGQSISLYNLFANVKSINPSDIGVATVEAIAAPGELTGSTLREGGELSSDDSLLTRSIFPEFVVGSSQRIISSESVSWSNP